MKNNLVKKTFYVGKKIVKYIPRILPGFGLVSLIKRERKKTRKSKTFLLF